MEISQIINDIIDFLKSFMAEVQAFFDSIVKNYGVSNPENYPEGFEPTTAAKGE